MPAPECYSVLCDSLTAFPGEYFDTIKKFVRLAVPQLVADHLTQFEEKLVVEFETYFNGEKLHHDEIAKAVADIVEKSVGKAVRGMRIRS